MEQRSSKGGPHCLQQMDNIDAEDMQYVERDLAYFELVSLGFLLYGDDHVRSQYILQKLLVRSKAPPGINSDLLYEYTRTNANWKPFVIEALAIIKAKRVLHKLGFRWEEVHQTYLPHIPELSVHINPLLKALYFLCERMPPAQAGKMLQVINDEKKHQLDHLRFYDCRFLEIYLLDWLSHKIIELHDSDASLANLRVILQYLKLNEYNALKDMLSDAIKSNSKDNEDDTVLVHGTKQDCTEDIVAKAKVLTLNNVADLEAEAVAKVQLEPNLVSNSYVVRRESAGIVLIINQKSFYEETDPELQHALPPKKLTERRGTDVDKERLKLVFSSFGYQSQDFDNLTHIQLLSRIRETVLRSFQYDSLIVCILSHGIDGCVYGCNSIPVEISVIEEIITAETLQGKPKMLIVQACQKDEPSVSNKKKKKISAANSRPDVYMDMIKAMSTVPGYASMRHTLEGSWFVQSICDKIDQLADTMQITDVLIAVTRAVTEKRGDNDEIMVPITNSTLTKHFFLPKR